MFLKTQSPLASENSRPNNKSTYILEEAGMQNHIDSRTVRQPEDSCLDDIHAANTECAVQTDSTSVGLHPQPNYRRLGGFAASLQHPSEADKQHSGDTGRSGRYLRMQRGETYLVENSNLSMQFVGLGVGTGVGAGGLLMRQHRGCRSQPLLSTHLTLPQFGHSRLCGAHV